MVWLRGSVACCTAQRCPRSLEAGKLYFSLFIGPAVAVAVVVALLRAERATVANNLALPTRPFVSGLNARVGAPARRAHRPIASPGVGRSVGPPAAARPTQRNERAVGRINTGGRRAVLDAGRDAPARPPARLGRFSFPPSPVSACVGIVRR